MFFSIFQNTFCLSRANPCNFSSCSFAAVFIRILPSSLEEVSTPCSDSFYSVYKEAFDLVQFVLNSLFSYLLLIKTTSLLNRILYAISFLHFIYPFFTNRSFHINYNCSFLFLCIRYFRFTLFSISFSCTFIVIGIRSTL